MRPKAPDPPPAAAPSPLTRRHVIAARAHSIALFDDGPDGITTPYPAGFAEWEPERAIAWLLAEAAMLPGGAWWVRRMERAIARVPP